MSEDVKSKAYTLEERLNQVCLKASKQSESDRNLLQWIKENDQEFWEENKLKRGILRQTLDRYRLIRRESKQKTISKRSRASHLLKPFQSPQIDSLPSISSYSTLFSTFIDGIEFVGVRAKPLFNNPDPTKVDLWLVYIKYPGGTYEHIKQVRALMDVQVCHLSEWTFDKLVGDSDSHLYRLNNQIEVKDIGCRFSDQIQSKLNKIDQAKRELTFYQNQLDLATSAGLLRAVQMAESNVNETIKRIAKLEKSLEQLIHCQSSTTTSTACQDQSCQDIFEPYFRQTIAPLELGCSIQQFMSFSSPASPFCQDFGESTAFQSSSIGSIDED